MITGKILAVISGPERSLVIPGRNIVTTDGIAYYAEVEAGGAITNDYPSGGLRLGQGTTTPALADTDVTTFITGAGVAITAAYPTLGDADADNPGAAATIMSWRYVYTANSFVASGISEGAIVDNIVTPTTALCHFLFAVPFYLLATEVLTIFINHTGVDGANPYDGESIAIYDPAGRIRETMDDGTVWTKTFPPFVRRTIWTEA